METQITLVFRPKKKSVTAIQHETAAINAPTTNGSPTATVNSAPRTYFRRKNSPKVLTNVRNWIVIPTCAHRSLVSLTIADARPLLPPNDEAQRRGHARLHAVGCSSSGPVRCCAWFGLVTLQNDSRPLFFSSGANPGRT